MRRFDAEYVALKKLITDGGLGNPLMVHCTHRNQMVGDHFNSEFMIRDSVVHEVDVARFLLDEEIDQRAGDQGGGDQRRAGGHGGSDAGDLRDRVRPDRHRRDLCADPGGVRGADRGGGRAGQRHDRAGPEPAGQDHRRALGWAAHAELRGAVRRRVRHRAAALGRRRPGRHHRRPRSLGRVRRGRGLRGRRRRRSAPVRRWPVQPGSPGRVPSSQPVATELDRSASPAPISRRPGRDTPRAQARRDRPDFRRHDRNGRAADEARARPADVLRHQLGVRAARHRGPAGLRLDGAVAEGGFHPVLQVSRGSTTPGSRS